MMNQNRISDVDCAPQISTVHSNMSYANTTTAFSESNPLNLTSNSSKSVTNLPSSSLGKPKFKRCKVQLLPDFKGYGFTLNSKMKPKYSIYTIDPNSPAYKANLRETDVIVQIDNKNVRRQKFETVAQFLNEFLKRGQMEILAIDLEGYKFYKQRKKRLSSNKLVTRENTEIFSTVMALKAEIHIKNQERVNYNTRQIYADDQSEKDQIPASNQLPVDCTRDSSSLHFDKDSSKTDKEQKFNRQQEVMGHLVLAMDNPELIKEVQTYNLYKDQDFFGYGIAFHTEDISISKPEHKLVYPLIEIEDNSPAAGAGMKNYQRVVAVNGDFVNKNFRTLEDVVQSIEDSYYSRDYTEISVIDSHLWESFMENPELAAKLAYRDTNINNNILKEEYDFVTRF